VEGDILAEIVSPESDYSRHWAEMSDRLRKGGSLSGRERNCAFLNLDGSHFATISSLSGFDFLDDSRSLALVDWDGDGRMDVWGSNRTAPRIRFLKNELASVGSWIQFVLQTDGLLDPIGARIEVGLGDGRTLLRTLRAGEGFLGQSSPMLHFGLGSQEVKSLRVRWPDGIWQDFKPVAPGQRYHIHKGQSSLAVIAPRPMKSLAEGPLEPGAKEASPWVRLPVAMPMPPLVITRPDESRSAIPAPTGKPLLINLWDPTCEDCATELLEWKAGRDRFPADLQVITLLVNPETTPAESQAFIDKIQLPFEQGRLDPASTQLLARLLQDLYKTRDQFAAPASFLVNSKGELASFTIGKVEVGQIISEVTSVESAQPSPLVRTFGSQGIWLDPVERFDLLFIPRALLHEKQLDLAAAYVRRAWSHLAKHRDLDLLLVWIGDGYLQKGNATEGLKFYLNALKNGTKDPVVMNNVAWQLATHPDPTIRNGPLAIDWAEKAVQVTEGKQATYYDTLAAAYAEDGRFKDALEVLEKGIGLATGNGEKGLLPGLLKARKLYSQSLPSRGKN